jgi:Na+/H+ antiporter NhaD/arsenite permease-like protein
VPFTWTFGLWPIWVGVIGYLLALFFVVDSRAYAKESKEDLARDVAETQPIRILGKRNVGLLLGVVGAVFLPTPWRELVMIGLAANPHVPLISTLTPKPRFCPLDTFCT